ncbi:hypothetical protein CALCODRAFT_490384 [Calocera cornea HHB12733]|uniref:Uncharacterized protein n=1 Tax=Calocera cornea HHB12733 TaxID=1353952 RepID=A0A165JS27_9BASI|nr:hypothetical protein CALCODRAFT_490384 [Calocera cornea HHB12733]
MDAPVLQHSHPFTLEEATLLPFGTLTQEIARLQHSISHLQRSQIALKQHLTSEVPDAELVDAVLHNEQAILAQNERITLIEHAIAQKGGASASGHYAIDARTRNGGAAHMNGHPTAMMASHGSLESASGGSGAVLSQPERSEEATGIDAEEEGVYL